MTKFMKIVGALAFGFIFTIAACSDNATNNQLTEGDPDDLSFQFAQDITDDLVSSLFNSSETAFDFLNFDGSMPSNVASDTFYVVFHESSC